MFKRIIILSFLLAGLSTVMALAVLAKAGVVVLSSFTVSSPPHQALVQVEWETAAEIDVTGFDVERSLSAANVYTTVNPALIPAQGDALTGWSYALTDQSVVLGTSYDYRLAVVNDDHTIDYYPPVRVTAGGPCAVVSCTAHLPLVAHSVVPIAPQFEVTQGVQQPDNSVRLIAGRTTIVRWTLTSGAGQTGVNAYLVGARNGVPLAGSPLAALNNSRTLKATADRAVLNDTFNFQLPADWAAGAIALSAYAADSAGFFTSTAAQNFTFASTPALPVTVVPIEYHCTNSSAVVLPGDAPYSYLTNYTYRTYPVPAVNQAGHAAARYDGPCLNDLPKPTSTDWVNMLGVVTSIWTAEGRPNRYYYGLVHIDCGSSCIAGLGYLGYYRTAVGFDGFGAAHSGAGETHAHEVGHNHGRDHAPGCGTGDADPAFPYVPADGKARIGDAARPNFGLDFNGLKIYTYSATYDVMSYCSPKWVSDYTYEALWQYDNVLRLSPPDRPIGAQSILVAGQIDAPTGEVTLRPAYVIDEPGRLPTASSGTYTLELLDANDRVLAAQPFEPARAIIDWWQGSSEETLSFHLQLPYVDGVKALRVRQGDRVVGQLKPGPQSPVIGSPENRSGQLSWSGRDADGDTVTYLVRASYDEGRTWEVIGLYLSEPMVTVAHGGLMEITASDGLNSVKTLVFAP